MCHLLKRLSLIGCFGWLRRISKPVHLLQYPKDQPHRYRRRWWSCLDFACFALFFGVSRNSFFNFAFSHRTPINIIIECAFRRSSRRPRLMLAHPHTHSSIGGDWESAKKADSRRIYCITNRKTLLKKAKIQKNEPPKLQILQPKVS